MSAHRILRPIHSDNGVIGESEEGRGSHAQFIHGKYSQTECLTRESNHLQSVSQSMQKQMNNNGCLKCDTTARQRTIYMDHNHYRTVIMDVI